MELREVKHDDYVKGHLMLYQQLTTIEPSTMDYFQYRNFVDTLNENHKIFVIEFREKIIGSVTVLIEHKLIHNFGKVAHIEDLVVDTRFRGHKLGQKLIEQAKEYAKEQNCYKILLDCKEELVSYYNKCGFQNKGSQMTIYT